MIVIIFLFCLSLCHPHHLLLKTKGIIGWLFFNFGFPMYLTSGLLCGIRRWIIMRLLWCVFWICIFTHKNLQISWNWRSTSGSYRRLLRDRCREKVLHLLEEALVAAHLTHSVRIVSAAWILISRSDHTFYTEASAGSLMQLGKCINDLLLGDASFGVVLVE